MFRSKAWKWLLIGSAVTIIVLYMLELTTAGIERVYGPLEQAEAAGSQRLAANEQGAANERKGLIPITEHEQYLPEQDWDQADIGLDQQNAKRSSVDQEIEQLEAEIAELKRLALIKEKEQLQQKLLLNEDAGKPAVNRMADSTSEVLQSASSSSIQFIAKLFSNVIN